MKLSSGNIAVIGMSGLRAEINTFDPSGQGMARRVSPSLMERAYLWLVPLLVGALLAGLLLYARRVQKRKDSNGS